MFVIVRLRGTREMRTKSLVRHLRQPLSGPLYIAQDSLAIPPGPELMISKTACR